MTDDVELRAIDALLASMARALQQARPLSPADAPELDGALNGNSRQAPFARLNIYREQFWLRHLDSLREDFPGTSALLGAAWDDLAMGYLGAHPPSTPSLRELGFQLADYLSALGPAVVPELAVDMARVETAYLEVFDAPDEAELDGAQVSALSADQWPRVWLEFSGALRLLELNHPVADLRRELRAGRAPDDLKTARTPIWLAVYRRERDLFDRELAPEAFALLRHLAAGVPLAEACERTVRARPAAGPLLDAHLGEWFSSWARLGWIARVHAPGPVS